MKLQRLGTNPWDEILNLIYSPDPIDTIIEFDKVLELLQAIKNEAWTKFLHLDQIIPMFESLLRKHGRWLKARLRAVLEVNPADFLTKVKCPVLAIFGEDDTSIPVEKSVKHYKQYLGEARNEDVIIKVFPNASHTIQVNDNFAPGYFETINEWLSNLTFN